MREYRKEEDHDEYFPEGTVHQNYFNDLAEKGTKKNPIVREGRRYIYGEKGRLVPLEHFDPNTMVKFKLTADTELDNQQIERMREFSLKEVEPDDECPELTDEQIEHILLKAKLQKING